MELEKIIYYNSLFTDAAFNHNKYFLNIEMFKYWLFNEYISPISTHIYISNEFLEIQNDFLKMRPYRETEYKNNCFMIEHYNDFLEYCKLRNIEILDPTKQII